MAVVSAVLSLMVQLPDSTSKYNALGDVKLPNEIAEPDTGAV
jgi:hypothetical protein